MRILFITDSVGFPHPQFGLRYEESYLSKLEAMGDLWVMGGGGYTIYQNYERTSNICKVVDDKFFDVCIIQLGIVDCAPRPVPYWLHKIIAVCPELIIKTATFILHNLRPLMLRLGYYQFTTLDLFKKIFVDLLANTQRVCNRTIIIGIAPVKELVNKHSPGLNQQIQIYNKTIKELADKYKVNFIDVSGFKQNEELYLTPDAHITKDAHTYIWDKVIKLCVVGAVSA